MIDPDRSAARLREMMDDPDPWWRVRLGGLAQLVEQIRPKTVLEIGCCRGHSTEVFLLYAESVTALDPWDEGGNEFEEFVMRCSHYSGLRIIVGRSPQDVPDKRFDLIYIDGDHSYEAVKADIAVSHGRCDVLAGHDWGIPGVRRAVEEHCRGGVPVIFPDTSWMVR